MRECAVQISKMNHGTSWLTSQTLKDKNYKAELQYDWEISLLGIHPKETGSLFWRDIYNSIFISKLFKIAKIGKKPKCLSMSEWMKFMCVHGGILFHYQKEIISFFIRGMGLEDIMLSE